MLSVMLCVSAILCQEQTMFDLVKNNRMAALSTEYKEAPFGSLSPYVLDKNGNPVIFISILAIHTKNLNKNPACSLTIWKVDEDDLFNSQRITFLGKMVQVEDEERKELQELFLKKHPESEGFIDFDDFAFYRLEIVKIYYIGGFGDIQWIELNEYRKGFGDEG